MPQIASGNPYKYAVGKYYLHVTSSTSLNSEKGDASEFWERKNLFHKTAMGLFFWDHPIHYT